MITKPTLFILGAGASIPYGFPSGAKLREQICSVAQSQAIFPNISAVSNFTGVTYADLKDFAKCFMLSGLSSIDTFLGRRTEFADIGKAVIAALLIPQEQVVMFNHGGNQDDWYFALWNSLVSNVSSLQELAQNQVQIFTFNYDRSLEKYLHTSIIHTFNTTQEQALEALQYFNIHHVYGSLGGYGLNEDSTHNTRPYKPDIDEVSLQISTKSLKVIPEARAEDATFIKAREAFIWADHVCFLGFGFDPLNIQRLGFRDIISTNPKNSLPYKVVASTLGRTYAEIDIIHDAIIGVKDFHDDIGNLRVHWDNSNYECLETLRRFAWLLQ